MSQPQQPSSVDWFVPTCPASEHLNCEVYPSEYAAKLDGSHLDTLVAGLQDVWDDTTSVDAAFSSFANGDIWWSSEIQGLGRPQGSSMALQSERRELPVSPRLQTELERAYATRLVDQQHPSVKVEEDASPQPQATRMDVDSRSLSSTRRPLNPPSARRAMGASEDGARSPKAAKMEVQTPIGSQTKRKGRKGSKRQQRKGPSGRKSKRKTTSNTPRTRPQFDSRAQFYNVEDKGLGSMLIAEDTPNAERKMAIHVACLYPEGWPSTLRPPKTHGALFKVAHERVVKFLREYTDKVTEYVDAFEGKAQDGQEAVETRDTEATRNASMVIWREWPVELKLFTKGVKGKLVEYFVQTSGKGKNESELQVLKELVKIATRWRKTHHQQKKRTRVYNQAQAASRRR
eukprot:m.40474 g.40474  ORF g.40474 m.40474 type:complete len:402 (-) comp12746_c0_seq1:393-1598(-)